MFILFKFGSNSSKISPPLFIYFIISSFSCSDMSVLSAVSTNTLQSSGILPFVNKFTYSTSLTSSVSACSKY